MRISEKASIPMPMGMSEMPRSSSTMPKVRRGRAETGSMPTVPTSTPAAAAMSPRVMDLVPSPAMMVMAMQMSAKISGGPMYRATAASGAAARISTRVAKASPVTEA